MNIANLSSSLVIFLSFFLVVAITIIVAHVSYFAFEKKFISISKSNISGDLEFEIKYENQFIGTKKNKIMKLRDNFITT